MKLFEVMQPVLELKMSDSRILSAIKGVSSAVKIGFEFELFVDWDQFGDPEVEDYQDPDQIYDNVAADVKRAIHHSNIKKVYLDHVEGDGSIKDMPDRHSGVEIITKPIPYESVPEVLRYYFDWIKYHGGTNDSCGLHINISIDGIDKDDLDYFKMALFMGEDYVLRMYDREDNEYAARHYDSMVADARGKGISGKNFDSLVAYMNRNMSRDKYRTFNISKNGYIEFRAAGGAGYENRYNTVLDTINRFVFIYALGADPQLGRQEYIKKVGQFFSKAADAHKVVADDDYGDVEETLSALFAKFVGSRYMRPEDFQWLVYALYHRRAEISSRVKLALRKYARQENIDEDDFRDRVDQDRRFDDDKDWEQFIQYAINLLALK